MGRDKFAAMAKATERQSVSPVNPPKRDKLAALAASRSAADSTPTSTTDAAEPRGNSKLAAMAAANTSANRTVTEALDDKHEKRTRELQEKMSKRKQILQDLDQAEDLTCKLLDIVHQTTNALQDMTSSSPELAQLSRDYRKTLQEIHPLLSRGTEALVQPYQNHTTETNQSMYAARVEMRLAKERSDVLKAFTELERQPNEEATGGDESMMAGTKRSREDDNDAIINK
ncbi:unnamed protein product [Cylindrotheca closterium]|uniref:Uncharacterized protein n=1 Tax=Cylindrotheca closterium TaxID=2856 RepID=A0AAD2CB63_9STRA|nr:unnamed protein product [Cylindrotheca closterium]